MHVVRYPIYIRKLVEEEVEAEELPAEEGVEEVLGVTCRKHEISRVWRLCNCSASQEAASSTHVVITFSSCTPFLEQPAA